MSEYNSQDYRLTDRAPDAAAPYSAGELTQPRSAAGVVSFLSSNERKGRWEMPRQFRALAVLGNVELDLRDAQIGYGLSVVEAVALMGSIDLIIPPHVTVECDGDSLLGTFTLKYEGKANPSLASRDRVIRVTGTAYLGAVTVKVKGPDERMLDRLARTFGMDRQS
ncbi:MAG TPA: LiaF domain-containing protein [Gemmatimonadaceae bacterium]|nr:LiaF domain-containing protein [Gemmatimonadaceae bacterium]